MNQDTCWCAGSQDTIDVLASDTGVLKNNLHFQQINDWRAYSYQIYICYAPTTLAYIPYSAIF